MPRFFSSFKPKRGFTLIELMVTMAILAVVSTIGFATYANSQIIARDGRRKQDLRALATALELYYQINKRYPLGNATNGYWQATNYGLTPWLDDRANAGYTLTPFDTQYINILPVDPIKPSTSNRFYAYINTPFDWGQGAGICKAGKYFVLFAPLENLNDKDRFEAAPFSVCGWSDTSGYTKSYVIVGQGT